MLHVGMVVKAQKINSFVILKNMHNGVIMYLKEIIILAKIIVVVSGDADYTHIIYCRLPNFQNIDLM